jgi:ribosomal protein L13E
MSEKPAKKKARAKPAAKKKKKAKEEVPAEVKPEPARVEMGPAPQVRVMARHDYSTQERRGKGFSFGELSAAGLTYLVARSLKVPVDIRRRSVLDWNVGSLKGWYKPAPKKAKEPKAEEQEEKPKKAKAKPAKKKAKKTKKE